MKAFLLYALMIFLVPVALFAPFWGLLSYLGVAYLRPQQWAFIPDARFSLAVAVATLAGYVLFEMPKRFPRLLPNLLLILLWLQMLVSTLASINPGESQPKMIEFTKVILIALLMTAMTDTEKRVQQLYLGTCGIMAFLALRSLARGFVGGADNRSYGPGGMFEDNNDYALLLVMALPLLYYAGRGAKQFWLKWGWYLSAFAAFMTVFFTRSRGGFVGLCVVMFLLAMRTKYKITGMIFVPVAMVLVLTFSPDVITERLRTIQEDGREDRSAQQRLDAWSVCLQIMQDYPLTGIGHRNLMEVYPRYSVKENPRVAHNSFLHLGAEVGIPALMLLLGLIGLSYFRLWRARQILSARAPDSPLIHYTHGLQVALMGYCASGFFVSRHDLELVYQVFAFATAMRMLAQEYLRAHEIQELVAVQRSNIPPAYVTVTVDAQRLPVEQRN